MPELLDEGLPERTRRGLDFGPWANGQAWKFVKGEDYKTATGTFRHHVHRWARAHGYQAEVRAFPALDRDGNPLPLKKADPVALGVVFRPLTE